MSAGGALTWAIGALYIAGGALGWALTYKARQSRRYYPALAHAGTALGLLPTYLLLLRGMRALGYARPPADLWQLLTLFLVLLASATSAALALAYAVRAARLERLSREARRRAGID